MRFSFLDLSPFVFYLDSLKNTNYSLYKLTLIIKDYFNSYEGVLDMEENMGMVIQFIEMGEIIVEPLIDAV